MDRQQTWCAWIAALGIGVVAGCSAGGGAPRDAALDRGESPHGDASGDRGAAADGAPTMDARADDAGPDADGGSAQTDAAPAQDGGPRCGATPADPHAAQRDGCMFAAGARVADTLGDVSALRAAIQHVVIAVEENHSLDNMFGTVGHGIEGFPADFTNPDSSGHPVAPNHLTTACPPDIGHSPAAITAEWNHGAMDGFARTDGAEAMGYYTDDDHPFYSWVLTTFATSDRYFCSLLDATGPNRRYLYAASLLNSPTLFDELNTAGVPWMDFFTTGSMLNSTYGNYMPTHHASYEDFIARLGTGDLPPVTFVELGGGLEHPPYSIHYGENSFRAVLSAAFHSPLWSHMAIVLTYDEGGGFFDHVPPPAACAASPAEASMDHQGVRVPLMVVSPYARAAYVSHRSHSHTSLLRFVQAVFDLPALSGRDANSDALLDLFDFNCPPFATPPASFPAAHPQGC